MVRMDCCGDLHGKLFAVQDCVMDSNGNGLQSCRSNRCHSRLEFSGQSTAWLRVGFRV